MTLLSAILEAEKSKQRNFTRQLVKVIFMLSPGYSSLPENLQFVYALATLLVEKRFDVVIHATNRKIDHTMNSVFRSELPAVWSDISDAIQRFLEHSTTRIVLDEMLRVRTVQLWQVTEIEAGSERWSQAAATRIIWFVVQTGGYNQNTQWNMVSRNASSTEAVLGALALRQSSTTTHGCTCHKARNCHDKKRWGC